METILVSSCGSTSKQKIKLAYPLYVTYKTLAYIDHASLTASYFKFNTPAMVTQLSATADHPAILPWTNNKRYMFLSLQMVEPAYQELLKSDIPHVSKDGVHVAVIAGQSYGASVSVTVINYTFHRRLT
jgi:hypothetical protein